MRAYAAAPRRTTASQAAVCGAAIRHPASAAHSTQSSRTTLHSHRRQQRPCTDPNADAKFASQTEGRDSRSRSMQPWPARRRAANRGAPAQQQQLAVVLAAGHGGHPGPPCGAAARRLRGRPADAALRRGDRAVAAKAVAAGACRSRGAACQSCNIKLRQQVDRSQARIKLHQHVYCSQPKVTVPASEGARRWCLVAYFRRWATAALHMHDYMHMTCTTAYTTNALCLVWRAHKHTRSATTRVATLLRWMGGPPRHRDSRADDHELHKRAGAAP